MNGGPRLQSASGARPGGGHSAAADLMPGARAAGEEPCVVWLPSAECGREFIEPVAAALKQAAGDPVQLQRSGQVKIRVLICSSEEETLACLSTRKSSVLCLVAGASTPLQPAVVRRIR